MNDWLWVEALRAVVRDPFTVLVFVFSFAAIAVALLFGGGRP